MQLVLEQSDFHNLDNQNDSYKAQEFDAIQEELYEEDMQQQQ